jgi:signal transduction histidine kinase
VDGSDLSEPLERLAQSLAEAMGLLQQTSDPERDRLLGLVGGLIEAVRSVAAVHQSRSNGATLAVGLSDWLHALREPATAITGWVQLMVGMPDEAKRVPAREAIERNVTRLRRLLNQPPA